ncbi:uncharacterized protein LOC135143781 [Zophobas morio]|uniref:uncharacterized protein LOC135143781 n=1 Tax=Zophobas morio TaxID=2755281 RepID=UPI0030836970
MNADKTGIKAFDPTGEESETAQKWDRWLRSFEIFLEASAIQNEKRKRALLLHHSGEGVQEVWYTLPESKREDEPQAPLYDICKTALTPIFQPKKNYTYERHVFRSLSQKEGETIIQFVTRLKAQSANCNFRNNADDMIIDQLIEKCTSNDLRRQLLKEGDSLTVDRAKELGRIFEASEKQAGLMEAGSQDIRRVEKKVNTKRPPKAFKCYRCDGEGHRASDEKCPARNKTCNKCGLIGHLGKCCRTKKKATEQRKRIRNIETGHP